MLTKILSFLLAVISVLTFNPLSKYDYSDRLGDTDYTGLKEYYADYFDIGAAVGGWHCQDSGCAGFLLKNYSSLTAENAFKQPAINPSEGVWNFTEADTIANFCRENGLKLRGHCLVWGGLGSWMSRDGNGELVSKEVYYERLRNYLSVIMPRYADIVSVWDVVNEPFGYDRKDGEFKDNDLYRICGEEYITKAFEIAHEVDPSAKLCLNECKVVNNSTKQKYLLKYLEKWLGEGVPIHAVGIQGHWSTFEINESPGRLQNVIDKLYKLGVDIQITEIDMEVTADKSEIFDIVPRNAELLQSKKYAQMFEVLRKNSDKISSVTFWGVSDNRPFTAEDGSKHYPSQLLFDKDNMPKNAFYAVCDFDTAGGIDGSVGFAIRKQDEYTTVYYGDSLISVDNLKAIARACGVHMYSDSGDVLMANRNLAVFHAVTAGEKTVTFEGRTDVWDYFNNKWYTDVDSITFSAGLGETRYLFFGDKNEIENWELPL